MESSTFDKEDRLAYKQEIANNHKEAFDNAAEDFKQGDRIILYIKGERVPTVCQFDRTYERKKDGLTEYFLKTSNGQMEINVIDIVTIRSLEGEEKTATDHFNIDEQIEELGIGNEIDQVYFVEVELKNGKGPVIGIYQKNSMVYDRQKEKYIANCYLSSTHTMVGPLKILKENILSIKLLVTSKKPDDLIKRDTNLQC